MEQSISVTVEQPDGQGRMAVVPLCYGLMVTEK